MSTSLFSALSVNKSVHNETKLLALAMVFFVSGCSSIKTPDAIKNLSLPNVSIPENHSSFTPRIYAGGSFGRSTLKPDTSGTPFNVAEEKARSSEFRLGMDLHNKLSVEINTSVLGKAQLAEGNNTDVSFTAASFNALIYGLNGAENRSRREGFSGYGRIGYGIVKHGSIVEPFDYSNNSIILGLGAEYGFRNGFAARAEFTRHESEATVFGIGGIYRFGMPPSRIGRIFADAAKPALGAASARTEVRNGKVVKINEPSRASKAFQSPQQMLQTLWKPKTSKRDVDGDGVANGVDQCQSTPANIIVNTNGCGMFDAVLSDVTFKPGSAWLTPRARGQLDALTQTLLAFPEARIQVRAHTDSNGPADMNLGLSARRAESVVAYLTEKGIGELQLETLGLGESQPLDTNETKEGRKRNRRVELKTLASIDTEQLMGSAPTLGAAKPVNDSAAQSQPKDKAQAVSVVSALSQEPAFPPMSGVKIEPLPKSAYVAGLSLGGPLGGVDFSDGTATLTADSKIKLNSVSDELLRFPDVRLVIMAHTDNSLPSDESLALSKKRANVVVNFLVSKGVDAARLSAEGFGSSLPLAQNLTAADRRRNERIELRVQK